MGHNFQLLPESFVIGWIFGANPGIKFLSESSESMLDRPSERDLFDMKMVVQMSLSNNDSNENGKETSLD